MTHVITQNCCNDASCVPVCPVNCIHPTPDEPDYMTAEMLYIDPDGCIDCGACVDACPVSAIAPDYELPPEFARYEDINAAFYAEPDRQAYDHTSTAQAAVRSYTDLPGWLSERPLRVAVVGSGPAGIYAAEELLAQRVVPIEVDMFERLLTPGGLVRFGVAPDHQKTKGVEAAFARTLRRKGLRLFLGLEIGRDITPAELHDSYDAVIYAHGAMDPKPLGLPGEDLPGSHSAAEFVAWYNGHPDFVDRTFDLSGQRAVIIGNGNVALDVARVLMTDPAVLARTDIADHALATLSASRIQEVVIVGRRGERDAAFTLAELHGLTAPLEGEAIAVVVDRSATATVTDSHDSELARVKAAAIRDLPGLHTLPDDASGAKRVVLRFLASPTRLLGADRVDGIRLSHNRLITVGQDVVATATNETFDLTTGLVLRAVGYRGRELAGLPFDPGHGVVPHRDGRVCSNDGEAVHGAYVAGWIKRGPSGVIGTNRLDARRTVDALFADLRSGLLSPRDPGSWIDPTTRGVTHVDGAGWKRIDQHERAAGKAVGRPRVKLLDQDKLASVARGETFREDY